MAAGSQLFFLYELESQVRCPDRYFHGYYFYLWSPDRKNEGAAGQETCGNLFISH